MTTETVTHVPSPPVGNDPHQKHDQLFKNLLQEFSAYVPRLFVPELAVKLKPESKQLNTEKFMEVGQKSFRRLDLLTEYRYRDETTERPRKMLVCTEIEHRFDKNDAERWKHYLSLVYGSEEKAALMLVIYLNGGDVGLQQITSVDYEDNIPLQSFTWWQYGLAGLSAEVYVEDSNLLNVILSVNMSRSTMSKAAHLAECLRRIQEEKITDKQRKMATVFVCSYLRLDKNEKEEYNHIILQPKYKGADNMMMTWDEEVRAEGFAKGQAEGIEKGIEKGAAKGKAEALLQLLSLRNIVVSDVQRETILACTNLETLGQWLQKVLSIQTVAELMEGASGTEKA